MTKVEVRNGNVDNALKRFKIKVARSGVPSELKKHKCYEKPGVRRRNELKEMIKEHVSYTNSEKGKMILNNFLDYLPKFKKIIPHDYDKMLKLIVQMEEKGLSAEQAQIEAFYAIKEV